MVRDSWRRMQVPIIGIVAILIMFSLVVIKFGANTDNRVGLAYSHYKLYDDEFVGRDGCSDLYDPVCGSDGLTYDNFCEARRAGVSVEYQGACYE